MEVGKYLTHVVVVGEGKTYDYLVKLKLEHGVALQWLLPFPGDWHILKNYALVLMKVYGEAGLKDLVYQFHRDKTANTVLTATNFDKTLAFLLQCWEAFYRFEIELFERENEKETTHRDMSTRDILHRVGTQ